MSVREPEGSASERRGSAQRVHFEALVAVGGEGNGGFEAESMDLSPEGMRLRTAFVPEIGDKLVCRFDGPGLGSADGPSVELIVEGEVAWRAEEAKGGEFGLKFTNLDDGALDAIRALSKPDEPDADPASAVAKGTRVRLHIEGLASPMKARVRDASSRDLEVGSNLEFLKVGRLLELEDVDKAARRGALIDHVKIEIDPLTSVPQLVVSLRYEGEAAAASAEKESAPADKPAKKRASSPPKATRVAAASAASQDDDAQVEDEIDAKPKHAAANALDSALRAGKSAGAKVAPALAFASAKAKDAMDGVLAMVQQRRADRAEAKKSSAPRRTTAAAPAGALRSEGRRLVRDDGDEIEEAMAAPAKPNRRGALLGGALGLLAVLAVFGLSQRLGHKAAKPAETADAAAAGSALSGALPPGAMNPLLPAPGASGVPVATIPLFGATPLSTTEAVPPPAPSAVASAAPAAGDAPAEDGAPGEGKSALVKEWGQGKVSHPKTLKIKLDGPLDGLVGASGAQGFTLTVPGHRVTSPSTDLARKDKRLAAVKIVNTSQGAEITVQFKDGVPPYLAKVKEDRLEITLGSETKTVAHKKTTKKKKKTH